MFAAIAAWASGFLAFIIIFDKTISSIKNEKLRRAWKLLITENLTMVDTVKLHYEISEVIINMLLPEPLITRKLLLWINSSLYSALLKTVDKITGENNGENKSNTIVGIMLCEKIKNSSNAQLLLLLSLIIHFSLVYLSVVELNVFIIFLVVIGLFFIHLDHKIIEYRINKGFYGKNEFEAIEIINFILNHSKKSDFDDGSGGIKKLMPTPEKSVAKNTVTNTEGLTA